MTFISVTQHRPAVSTGFHQLASTRSIRELPYKWAILVECCCGHGAPHFFEKQGAEWHEVSVQASIEVWYS
jgi:hypothetical protein